MEVVGVLSSIADREGIEVSETALTVIARSAGGSFRDAIGTLDQLATYSGGTISLQETLDILGIVRHDLLFELVDLVHESDTQGALLFVEQLSQSGTDYVQFMKDLLGHLRDLYVTMHTTEVPASIALPEEQLARLQSQARRVLTAQTVLFIDLLGEALRAVRQGSDPRLELELVLIKMTALSPTGAATAGPAPGRAADSGPGVQPAAEPVKEPTSSPEAKPPIEGAPSAVRVPSVETKPPVEPGPSAEAAVKPDKATGSGATAEPDAMAESDEAALSGREIPSPGKAAASPAPEIKTAPPEGPATVKADIDHLRRAWPLVLEAVKKRQAGLSAVLGEGRPDGLENDELIIRFPAGYSFQADQVTRGDNPRILSEVLRDITGKDLRIATRLAADTAAPAVEKEEDARILSKDELIRVLQQEFDAREIE
jgi:DNA polymerase-3 subunit gamma/tau